MISNATYFIGLTGTSILVHGIRQVYLQMLSLDPPGLFFLGRRGPLGKAQVHAPQKSKNGELRLFSSFHKCVCDAEVSRIQQENEMIEKMVFFGGEDGPKIN